jgi:hypothetical protein
MLKGRLSLIVNVFVVVLIIASMFAMTYDGGDDEEDWKYEVGSEPLAEDYMVFVDAPESEEDMALIYALSSIVNKGDVYHPLFIMDEDGLDDHQLWTIEFSSNKDVQKYLFSNGALQTIEQQMVTAGAEANIIEFPFTRESVNSVLRGFKENSGPNTFSGEIKVRDHREALWVAPLAAQTDSIVTLSKFATYKDQSDVWNELNVLGVSADYIVVANPDDYQNDDVFYSIFEDTVTSYHYPSMAAVAAEIALVRNAYVITDIDDLTDVQSRIPAEYTAIFPDGNHEMGDLYDQTNDMFLNNVRAYGYYEKLVEVNENYGPISYVCLVGGAEALPQFEFYDYSMSEGMLADPILPEYTSSDVAFGFLDPDRMDYMTAAVGRIINLNVQGASNQIARTFGYDYIAKELPVNGYVGQETMNWEEHASSWNGYEVADARLQNYPAVAFIEDAEDEGYDTSYWATTGQGAGYVSDGGVTVSHGFQTELEASGLVAYRGHGSWHGSFYTWGRWVESNLGVGDQLANHVEGTELQQYFLPPQVSTLVSCENSKIHGTNYRSTPIVRNEAWAPNYMYAGALGLSAATEVSYSNIGQDIWATPGQGTGDSQWDINDLWYAGFWDGVLDGSFEDGQHNGPEVSGAEAVRNTENRYIENLKSNFDGKYTTPFLEPPTGMIHPTRGELYGDESGMHWKETAMFSYIGEPMFQIPVFNEGEGSVDPWH